MQDSVVVVNETRGSVLAHEARVATGHVSRLLGLMGRRGLRPGHGLLLRPCKSVHTCFMRFAIDVAFVDVEHHVLAITHAMKPWRFSRVHRRARYVVELPAGTLQRTATARGDRLRLLPMEEATPDYQRLLYDHGVNGSIAGEVEVGLVNQVH